MEAGYRALLSWALSDAQKLCEVLGERRSADVAARAARKLNRKTLPHNNLKQAAALMAVAGMMDPLKASEEVIAVDGAKRFSTFYGLYMLDALTMAGMQDEALKIVSDYWGGCSIWVPPPSGKTSIWSGWRIQRGSTSSHRQE